MNLLKSRYTINFRDIVVETKKQLENKPNIVCETFCSVDIKKMVKI